MSSPAFTGLDSYLRGKPATRAESAQKEELGSLPQNGLSSDSEGTAVWLPKWEEEPSKPAPAGMSPWLLQAIGVEKKLKRGTAAQVNTSLDAPLLSVRERGSLNTAGSRKYILYSASFVQQKKH